MPNKEDTLHLARPSFRARTTLLRFKSRTRHLPKRLVRLWRLINALKANEADMIETLLQRLHQGRKDYGPWRVDDGRNNPREALAEVLDALNYCAAELVRLGQSAALEKKEICGEWPCFIAPRPKKLSDAQPLGRLRSMSMITNPLVVTRHPALVDFLRGRGLISGDAIVKAQVSPDDVAGRHVVGVLPLHLAALCSAVTVVDLDVPAELRGAELTLTQLEAFARGITTYHVRVLP